MNDSMIGSRIAGGNTAYKRSNADFYPTPPDVTFALLNFLRLSEAKNVIWEPACGEGHMVKQIRKMGYDVFGTDIRTGTDFLTADPPRYFTWIITNPPFSLSEQFIRRCGELKRPFALLLKAQYWHAKRRVPLFREHMPSWVLPRLRTTGENAGWKNDVQGREAAYAAGYWCKTPETIRQAAERLRKVQIECRPAVEMIRRFNFPNVLIYADPPYVLGTRHGKQYRHEMTDVQHEELLVALLSHRGPVLLSGYDSDIYRDMLSGWHREEIAERAQTSGVMTEVLWMNFEPMLQETLFERLEDQHEPETV